MRQNTKHSANNRSNVRPKNAHYRPNHPHDANTTDKRFRGTAHQMHEKYLSMARDAVSAGNRIDAETYYQHADHFYRVSRGSFDDVPMKAPVTPVASIAPLEPSTPPQAAETQVIDAKIDVDPGFEIPVVEIEE